jgi:hypothetical protein
MTALAERRFLEGAIAQLVERVLCKHEVVGSIPSGSTITKIRDRGKQVSVLGFAPGDGENDIVN